MEPKSSYQATMAFSDRTTAVVAPLIRAAPPSMTMPAFPSCLDLLLMLELFGHSSFSPPLTANPGLASTGHGGRTSFAIFFFVSENSHAGSQNPFPASAPM